MTVSGEALHAKAQALQLLLFDVDGVLTDGSVHLSGDGSEAKSFWIRDGSALVWAQRHGLQVGLISGRASEATTRRAAELGIRIVSQGVADKKDAFGQILAAHRLEAAHAAYMGDDLMDLPVLTACGLSAAPADAAPEVLSAVDWVSRHGGGRGAVREFVELVLRARGRWDAVVAGYRV